MATLYTFISTVIGFIILDVIWLGLLMKDFYDSHLGALARRNGEALAPIWWSAVIVYILVPLGVTLFAVPRAIEGGTYWHAIGYGFVLGIITYGVYGFTSYALLENWSLRMMLIDVLWGGFASAVLTVIGYSVYNYFA